MGFPVRAIANLLLVKKIERLSYQLIQVYLPVDYRQIPYHLNVMSIVNSQTVRCLSPHPAPLPLPLSVCERCLQNTV